jgi:uncharacterized protein with FMN-binding domain
MNAPIDPLLQQRLAQLGSRRPGSPLPPPTAGPAAKSPSKPSKPGRRAKPARAAKLSALALSAVTTLGLTVVFANQNGETDSVQLTNGTAAGSLVTVAAATPATTVATAASTPATTVAAPIDTTATTTPATTTAATTAVATGVLDGTYVGAGDTNRWGTVQVQVVYSGGQVTDVQILQYPDGERKSVRINEAALPRLISEALTSQSANVNTVSGATYTSKSYRISLQSAIDAANAASGISG